MMVTQFKGTLAAVGCFAFVALGCGGTGIKEIPNVVPCSGSVTYDGKSLDHGTVFFTPEDDKVGKAATGAIKNGSFQMLTTVSAPGVVIGKYKVAIISQEVVKYDPQKPNTKAPSLIPEKYSKITTSGLEANVTKGMSAVKFDLKKE